MMGARILAWLAPEADGPVEEFAVAEPDGQPLEVTDGILARNVLVRQFQTPAAGLISIRMTGSSCLVEIAEAVEARLRHLTVALEECPSGSLDYFYCSTDCLRRRGAAMQNLPIVYPSKPGKMHHQSLGSNIKLVKSRHA